MKEYLNLTEFCKKYRIKPKEFKELLEKHNFIKNGEIDYKYIRDDIILKKEIDDLYVDKKSIMFLYKDEYFSNFFKFKLEKVEKFGFVLDYKMALKNIIEIILNKYTYKNKSKFLELKNKVEMLKSHPFKNNVNDFIEELDKNIFLDKYKNYLDINIKFLSNSRRFKEKDIFDIVHF